MSEKGVHARKRHHIVDFKHNFMNSDAYFAKVEISPVFFLLLCISYVCCTDNSFSFENHNPVQQRWVFSFIEISKFFFAKSSQLLKIKFLERKNWLRKKKLREKWLRKKRRKKNWGKKMRKKIGSENNSKKKFYQVEIKVREATPIRFVFLSIEVCCPLIQCKRATVD